MSKYILEEYEPEKEQKVKVKVSNEKYSSKVRLLKRKTVDLSSNVLSIPDKAQLPSAST